LQKTIKVLIAVGDYLPPCSGSSERVWNLARELTKFADIFCTAHVWRPFKSAESIEVIPFPSWRFRIWELARWLKNLLRYARYDILQVELLSPLRSLILRVSLHPFIGRSVLVIHDLSWIYAYVKSGKRVPLYHLLVLLNFLLYDLVVFVSKDLEEFYVGIFGEILRNKTMVIPTGLPPEAFTDMKEDKALLREKLNLPKDAFIVMFFGPLHAPFNREAIAYIYKISDYLACAFNERTGKSFIFVIAGRGTEMLKHTPHVKPLGFVDNIFKLLKAVDACIVPHRASYTGPHVKTLYAFAAGCPVISTRDGVKGLEVEPYKHYIPFDSNNPATLLNALILILQDVKLRQRIVENARAYARKYFWKNIAKEYVELLLKLLTARG